MYSQIGEKKKNCHVRSISKFYSYCDDSYPVNKTFGGDIDEIYIEFRTNLRRQVTLIGCNLRIKSLNNFLM